MSVTNGPRLGGEGKGRDSRRDTGTNRLIVNQTDRKSERETDRGRLMTERL
jgi:hypothetical protein